MKHKTRGTLTFFISIAFLFLFLSFEGIEEAVMAIIFLIISAEANIIALLTKEDE